MKDTLIHKFNETMLFLILRLTISVVPALAHETSLTLDIYPEWSQVDRLVLANSPDSEYSTEELPPPTRPSGVDLVAEMEWDEPDSEYSLEELPAPVKEIEVEPVIEMEWSEPDSEY